MNEKPAPQAVLVAFETIRVSAGTVVTYVTPPDEVAAIYARWERERAATPAPSPVGG